MFALETCNVTNDTKLNSATEHQQRSQTSIPNVETSTARTFAKSEILEGSRIKAFGFCNAFCSLSGVAGDLFGSLGSPHQLFACDAAKLASSFVHSNPTCGEGSLRFNNCGS